MDVLHVKLYLEHIFKELKLSLQFLNMHLIKEMSIIFFQNYYILLCCKNV